MFMILLMPANGKDGDQAYLGIFRRGQAAKKEYSMHDLLKLNSAERQFETCFTTWLTV